MAAYGTNRPCAAHRAINADRRFDGAIGTVSAQIAAAGDVGRNGRMSK